MPTQELKRIFQSGKMNLDLDERLVPNGEYRYGVNINIGRSEGSDVGAVENLLGNEVITNSNLAPNSVCVGVYRENGNDRIYYFTTDEDSASEAQSTSINHAVFEFDQRSGVISRLAHGAWLNLHVNSPITGINVVDGLLFWTDDRNEPRKINIDRARANENYYNDILASVAKFAPFTPPEIRTVSTATRRSDGQELPRSEFLQRRLIRFAYRFRFEDNERSIISPFTTNCFALIAPITFNAANSANSGEIEAFINEIQSINLRVNIPEGYGITSVELLWKEQASNTVYIVEDRDVEASRRTVDFEYTSQDPFRALPGSQITRVTDAVPRLAKSQEIAGGRIVYGNFLHRYDVPPIDFDVAVLSGSGAVFHTRFPNYSVKSRRTYQVGLVLSDRFGRQTPVILSSSGNDTVFVAPRTGNLLNARQSLRVTINNIEEIRALPWVHSIRVFVKQREQEYYNWFSGTGNTRMRLGDSVNKIPVDTTQAAGGNNAPSSVSVYPKLLRSGANDADTGLRTIEGINTNDRTVTVANDTGTGSQIYETEPFISNLDIFFETSTGVAAAGSGASLVIPVDYYNCFIQDIGSGHIEINRIRAGFNEAFWDYGVKAGVVDEDYSEERRFNALIHSSGLFNSRTSINQLNQFNEAEGGITLALDPSDGSIQKLYAEDTQLIIFQEDKVSRSPVDKDFIYSAEGGAVPVTSNSQYLGTIAPYAGEYGISTDPGSFAVYGTRKYFSDRNRGVVIRLSQDGLTEISRAGMTDFFRDALRTSTDIVGSFDEYSDTYNIRIRGRNYTANEDTNIVTAGNGYFTISFEEDVNGWSSFKTFNKEFGSTLNNRYYTFSGGNIYEHNSTSSNRNTFYGAFSNSDLELIFNDNPSTIKEFKTLSYEGTQGWDCEYLETDVDGVLDGSETSTVATMYTATLNIDSSMVENARIVGAMPITSVENSPVTWIIYAEANSGFRFNSNLLSTQASIPANADVTGEDVPMINDDLSRVYWEITLPSISQDTTISLAPDVSPERAIFDILLEVRVEEGSLLRGQLSSTSHDFTEADFVDDMNNAITQNVEYFIIPDDNYYYYQNPTTFSQVFSAPTLATANAFTVDAGNIDNRIGSFDVSAPTELTTLTSTVSGPTPARYDLVTFNPVPILTSDMMEPPTLLVNGGAPSLSDASLIRLAATGHEAGSIRVSSGMRTITVPPAEGYEWTLASEATEPAAPTISINNTEGIAAGTASISDRSFVQPYTISHTGDDREYQFTITGTARRLFEEPQGILTTFDSSGGDHLVINALLTSYDLGDLTATIVAGPNTPTDDVFITQTSSQPLLVLDDRNNEGHFGLRFTTPSYSGTVNRMNIIRIANNDPDDTRVVNIAITQTDA